MTDPLVVTRTIAAPVERVYRAWTDPVEMSKWFYVGDGWHAEVTADVRVGGHFRIEMHNQQGDILISTGRYLELMPPKRIKVSWNSYAVSDTTVTIDLEPDDDGTVLVLTHEDLPSDDSVERHLNGWGATLDRLTRLAGELRQ